MFRSLFLVVLLVGGAGTALAKYGTPSTGACVADSQRFCGAPAMMGSNKKPVPCLVVHLASLTQECQAKVQAAMSPKKS